MKRICVFCGSSSGEDPVFAESARALGTALAARDISLVYGGASVGLMGAVADAALAAGGRVTGVIPQALMDREIAHAGLTELRVVGSMHERKALMSQLSDGFVAMPGGLGTLEEIFEVWTWAQLGDHEKPCAFLNVGGFYDGLIAFLDGVVARGFIRPAHRAMAIVATRPDELLDRMERYRAPPVAKWIEPGER